MSDSMYFYEEQKFKKWWHYLIAGFPTILMIVIFVLVQLDMVETKDNSKDPALFVCLIIGMSFFFFWFLYLKLITRIDSKGIFVHFRGIPFCKRNIAWTNILSISVINYSPLSDYGGWGVKYGMGGNGWCYNVSGTDGIKLITTDNKPFLIGTQSKIGAQQIIDHYTTT